MKSYYMIFLLTTSILIGCNNEDTNFTTGSASDILGTWSLINVSGGEAGVDIDYEFNLIEWSFDGEMLSIENNNPEEDQYDYYDSGNYFFDTLEKEEDLYFIFDNREFGKLSFSENEMIIDGTQRSYGAFNDSFVLLFKKIN